MKVIIDIEANSSIPERVKSIWCIVCKDIDTSEIRIFRNVHEEQEAKSFKDYASLVDLWIGHNILGYDFIVLARLLDQKISVDAVIDTYILSKLSDYSRVGGHSLEQYGQEFGLEKNTFSDFTKWSQELEDRCVRDVEINHLLYTKFLPVLNDTAWSGPLQTEQYFQVRVVNKLHDNGFAFNTQRANTLLAKVVAELKELDDEILRAFPPRSVKIRDFTPKATKFGTINKTSVPRRLWSNIHNYQVGQTYPLLEEKSFNPSSHKQLIDVLTDAKWAPTIKTKTHLDLLQELNKLKRQNKEENHLRLEEIDARLISLKKYGWKVNEDNLSSLPVSAPAPARTLAKRILLESRRRTLVEWLGLVSPDNRIHGKFIGIGAWTHRMAHQEPNTANIPNAFKENGQPKLLGKELRSLWIAPRRRLLLGVDAESIQFRIFAHYVNSTELTNAIVNGKKADKTDPHSYNQRVLGRVCRTRQASKRFLYALLLGAGLDKLAEVLECSRQEAEEALGRLLREYPGFAELKKSIIPRDARRGYFIGLDGRHVPIPGESLSERKHLCMSGYLQNGEAIVMKKATLLWQEKLHEEGITDWLLVDLVHDEWQTEVPNNIAVAQRIGQVQSECLLRVGGILKLNCPMAGSFWNDDKEDFTIGPNWYTTH